MLLSRAGIYASTLCVENLIQPWVKSGSNAAVIGSLACKALQIGIAARTFSKNLHSAILLGVQQFGLSYLYHKYLYDSNSPTLQWFFTGMANVYRVYLSIACGYMLDPNGGHVMAVSASVLQQLSINNMLHDHKYLGKELRSLTRRDNETEEQQLKREAGYEGPVCSAVAGISAVYLASRVYQEYICK